MAFREPEADPLAVFLVGGAVSDEQILFLGQTQRIPHRDVEKGEQHQKGRMHQKCDHPPQGEFPNGLGVADPFIDSAVHFVFTFRSHGLFPGMIFNVP